MTTERPSGFFPEPCRCPHIRLQFPFLERERLLRRGSRVEAVASYLELGGRGTVLLAVSPALYAALDSSPAVAARDADRPWPRQPALSPLGLPSCAGRSILPFASSRMGAQHRCRFR